MLREEGCYQCKYLPRVSSLIGAACTIAGLVVWAIYALQALKNTRNVLDITEANIDSRSVVGVLVNGYNIVVIVMCSVTSVVLFTVVFFSGYMMGLAKDKLAGKQVNPSVKLLVSQYGLQWVVFLLLVLLILLLLIDATWLVAVTVTKYSAETASTTFNGIVEAVGAEKPREAERVLQLHEQEIPLGSSDQRPIEGLLKLHRQGDPITDIERKTYVYSGEFAGNVEVQRSLEQLAHQLKDTTLHNLYQAAEDADRLSKFSDDGVCPTNSCMDLSIYGFLGTDLCLCDPVLIRQVLENLDTAKDKLILALIGNSLSILGQALLLCAVTAHSAQLVFIRRQLKAESRRSSRSIPEVQVLPSAPPSSGLTHD